MIKTFQLIIKDDKDSISLMSNVTVNSGSVKTPLIVQAQKGVQYELRDIDTNVAPNQVLLARKGKNLLIKFDVEDELVDENSPADIIIENYYNDSMGKLVGLGEDGSYYDLVPQEGNTDLLAANLADGESAYSSLGISTGTPVLAPVVTPVAADSGYGWWPYVLGAVALGGLGALIVSSGGDDDTPPIIPTPATTAQLDPASDTGTVGDGITSDTTPTISGTGDAGNEISVVVGTETVTTTVKPDGTWEVTPTTPLIDGDYTVIATETDPAGNTSTANVPVTIDTTPPLAPTAVTITEDTNNDGILNGTELVGNVDVQIDLPAGVVAGDTVNVTDGTTTTPIVITPTDITNGNVTTSFTPPAEGETITITATITDIAGNTGPSTTDSALIDTTAPTTTVDIDSISVDSGVVGDFITNDNDGLTLGATLSTALVAGEALMYSNDNGMTWSDITTSVTATAVSYDDANLTSTNTVQMKVVDLAGNDGAVESQLVTIAFTGPNNPITIDSITDDTGSSSSDFVTNDANGLTVAATLTNTLDTGAGEKLMYSNDNGVTWSDITSSVTATAVSYDDANLTSTATVKMKVVDVSDNDGPVAAQEVIIDTTAPTTTVDITSITDDTGADANDFITNDNDGLTIGATLSAGLASDEALMYSNDNGVTWSDITADVAGTTVTHTDANLTSTNTVQMKVVDLAGNDGAVNTQLVTIDTTVPTITPTTSDTVSEEALANGLNVNASTPSATIAGTMVMSDDTSIIEIAVAVPTTTIKSEGVDVTWSGSYDANSGIYTLTGSAAGETVATLSVNKTGAYTFTLAKTLDHPTANAEDILALGFGVTATDVAGNTNITPTTLTINVQDDMPIAVDAKTFVMDIQPDSVEGSLVVGYGADGGYVSTIEVDGDTYTYNPETNLVTPSGNNTEGNSAFFDEISKELTINTSKGETFVVDMETGEYSYSTLDAYEEVGPEVSVNQSSGLLGIANVGALGAIGIGTNQTFSAVDANNNIESVVVRSDAVINLGVGLGASYELAWSSDMAAEFGLNVAYADDLLNLLLVTTQSYSQLTITSIDGGPIDNLQLNEFLATVYVKQNGLDLVSLGLVPELSISATDTANNTGTATASDVLGLSLIDSDNSPAGIVEGSANGDSIDGTADSDRIYGYDGDDTLNGGQGNDLLRGGAGTDVVNGGAGDDVIIGGAGNDTLSGGSGSDTFIWEEGNEGVSGAYSTDTITDFDNVSVAAGGDIIDLSGMLQGELARGNSVGNLANYLYFDPNGTTLYISTIGEFSTGFDIANADQVIVFDGVDFIGSYTTNEEIISQMLSDGSLVVDQEMTTTDELNEERTFDATIIDNDGDTASTSVTFDTRDPEVNPLNVAPVVQTTDQQLLGLVGVGALSTIDLTSQALTAGDEDGNLRSVVVAYASTVDVNLSDLQFTASSKLAEELGLQFTVVSDPGLLGLVTPSTTITITSIDGGNIDNDTINEFLATVKFYSDTDLLGLSADAKVSLIDGTTITATDSLGETATANVGNLADVDALETLISGNSAIIEGSSSNDTLTGTADAERIYGYEGDDTLNGGDGDDLIRGGSGDDTLNGGDGNDYLIDGNGSDTFNGGAGNDVIGITSTNFNSIDGGTGVDTISMIGNFDFDLSAIDDSKISNIDRIDMTNGDANTLTLTYDDLLAINESDELYITGDTVDIVALEGHTFKGTQTLSGVTYNTYNIGGTDDADIWIQQDITVI